MFDFRRRGEAEARRPIDSQNFFFKIATTPFAALNAAVTAARAVAYDRGWLVAERLPGNVISIGNLAVGGTGKTPVVIALARHLVANGARPAILTRGYGAAVPNGVGLCLLGGDLLATYALNGRGTAAMASILPDEAREQSNALPTVPVLVGARRAKVARAFLDAATTTAPTHWLLDDGFQHRAIQRDVDLVLLDGAAPFGNGRLLPRGILREPQKALSRGHFVLLTRAAAAAPTAAERGALAPFFTGEIFSAPFVSVLPNVTVDGNPIAPDALRDVLLVSGIAFPDRLAAEATAILGRPPRVFLVADHEAFDVAALREAAAKATLLLTTAKDYWRDPTVFAELAKPTAILGLAPILSDAFFQAILGRSGKSGQ